ncbi:MAG: hypothetical protein L3J52_09885, partial [Proteobacteria bacterium]|nr:hypothetical protein [Pseudomonadota bacterium]
DNDGDRDVVVSNNSGKSQILLNQMNPDKWFGLRFGKSLQNIKKITLKSEDLKFLKVVSLATDGSYASASDNRLLLNKAETNRFNHVEIIFMDGTVKIIAININNTYKLIP